MKGFTLIELAIVIVIAALLAAVAVPIYNGIVTDSKWSEGKTAVGAIKAAMDAYSAKTGADLGSFVSGDFATTPANYTLIRLEPAALQDLQYFSETDFDVTIVGAAAPHSYTITLTASGGGNSGNGPTAGTITYTSATATWAENY